MGKKFQNNQFFSSDLFSKTTNDAESLLKVLDQIETKIKSFAKAQKDSLSGGLNDVKSINKAANAQESLNKAQKIQEQINKRRIKIQEKLNVATNVGSKQNTVLNERLKEQNRLNRQQAQAENSVFGAYKNTNGMLNLLIKKYRDLAIRKELGEKLTKGEIRSMAQLEKRITKLDGALKKVDKQTGRNFRNVGNYQIGFNGLSNSINQLTREAPAFANSMQTGFLALSNNIPILFDEIRNLRLENQRLAASGKQTKSILTQVGASIFSLQTLISVGVTLLTLYGSRLFEMATGLSKAEKAMKEYNDAMAENIGNVKTELVELKSLIQIVQDETESRERRNEAVEILQDKYPKYLENLSIENSTSEEIARNVAKITIALQEKAKFQAAEQLVTKKAQELYKEQLEAEETYQETLKNIPKILNANSQAYSKYARGVSNTQLDRKARETRLIREARRDRALSLKEAEDEFNEFSSMLAGIIKNTPSLFDLFDFTRDEGKKKSVKDFESDILEKYENRLQNLRDLLSDIDEKRENLVVLSDEQSKRSLEALTIQREALEDIIEVYEDLLDQQNKYDKSLKKGLRTNKELRDKYWREVDERVKKELEQEKRRQELVRSGLSAISALVQQQFNEAQRSIELQLNNLERRVGQLQQRAAEGNLAAEQSLAEEEKKRAELEQKRDRARKQQQQAQAFFTVLETYQSKVASGDPAPLVSTVRDVAVLRSLAQSLGSFYEGTDDIGKRDSKIDNKGGRLIVAHDNEQIWSKKDRDAVGWRNRDEIKHIVQLHDSGLMGEIMSYDMKEMKPIKSNSSNIEKKLDSLNRSVKNIKIPEGTVSIDEVRKLINVKMKKGNKVTTERSRLYD